jgi:NAD(P)-dependent dehydrogenase (short-subunit alcohol dehydrogenase family)
MFSLSGKTVIVTGGGRGVGRGISRAMAMAGANVVITGRSPGPLEEAAEEGRRLGAKCLTVPGDITDGAFRGHLIERTLAAFGALDGLVNNAGSADPKDVGPLLGLDEGQFDRVVDLNLKSAFFVAQGAARAMQDRGGAIVNISSRSGSFPCPNTGQYGAAKAGLESLTMTMATEWGHMGIRVNALALGIVRTENSSSHANPKREQRNIEITPLRRLGEPDDVGPLCVAFVSDETSWVSGTVVRVDGGGRLPVGLLTYFHQINRKMEAKAAGQAAE